MRTSEFQFAPIFIGNFSPPPYPPPIPPPKTSSPITSPNHQVPSPVMQNHRTYKFQ